MKEKIHRLPPEFYIGEVYVAFTICTRSNSISLINNEIFRNIEKILLQELKKYNCTVEIYLFMKDHIHMIIKGNDEYSNLLNFMKSFKQKSGYFFLKNYPDTKWQKDFYDHIIRNDNDVRNQVFYILENPTRKNLVEHWKEYKYKGSTVHNFDEWD
jgi:putative transposase